MDSKELSNLRRLIEQLSKAKFYGKIEVSFEAGKPVIVRKTESIKLNA